jgi:hypothetical protein
LYLFLLSLQQAQGVLNLLKINTETMKILLILIITFLVFVNCDNKERNRKRINCQNCLVTKEETAQEIAESILFENYGEDKIKSERPYVINIEHDSLWNIRGSFNKIGFGGVFNIKISAENGRVVEMYHEK